MPLPQKNEYSLFRPSVLRVHPSNAFLKSSSLIPDKVRNTNYYLSVLLNKSYHCSPSGFCPNLRFNSIADCRSMLSVRIFPVLQHKYHLCLFSYHKDTTLPALNSDCATLSQKNPLLSCSLFTNR